MVEERAEQMTKTELLDRIRSERQNVVTTLAPLDAEEMVEPGVTGVWSVKDILAHISAWERRMIAWVGEAPQGAAPFKEDEEWDVDRINEEIYQEYRETPLNEVLAEFRESYIEALRVVEETPEEALLEADRYPWLKGDPLWTLVAANTFWHYKEHGEGIQAWLEG